MSHQPTETAQRSSRKRAQKGAPKSGWDKFPAEHGFLQLSPDRTVVVAVCTNPSHPSPNGCRLTRSVNKQPLGFLLSWLRVHSEHPNRTQNFNARLSGWFEGAKNPRKFVKRQDARDFLYRNWDAVGELLDAEGPPTRAEPKACP